MKRTVLDGSYLNFKFYCFVKDCFVQVDLCFVEHNILSYHREYFQVIICFGFLNTIIHLTAMNGS